MVKQWSGLQWLSWLQVGWLLRALAVLVCSAPALALAHRPPPPAAVRATAAIDADVQGSLRTQQVLTARLAELGRHPARRDLPDKVSLLTGQLLAEQQRFSALLHELAVARQADADWQVQQAQARCQPAPQAPIPPPPPPPVHAPHCLPDAAFAELHQRLRALSFDRDRLAALQDAIHAGARLSAEQAVQLQALFTFGDGQVRSAAQMCKHAIVEAGALPRLIAALRFESDRNKLRKATGNRCGVGM